MSAFRVGRRRCLVASCAAAALGPPAWAQGEAALPATLRLGLVPYLSTRSMVAVFEPLRAHLERELQVKVELFTAAGLRGLGENLRRGDYDIAFAPAHFLRLAELEWNYRIVAQVNAPAKLVIVTRSDSPLRSARDLEGKKLVSLDRLAITSMVALEWLASNNLQPGRNVDVEFLVTASTSIRALEDPAVAAVALTESQMADFPQDMRDRVRTMVEMASVPPPGYAVAKRLGTGAVERITRALVRFDGTADGRGSLSRSPIIAASLAGTEGIDRYAAQLRQLLN